VLPNLIKLGFFMFLVEHTWLVLIIPVEYTAHMFSAIFSLASATFNLHVVWIASEFAS
jgi:hypothetical protein